jgi:hypothetical protein
MQRNVIAINSNDFNELKEGDFYQAAETFKLMYIIDDPTIEKIKII